MPNLRDARNIATGAQSTVDEFVHLITEAALDEAAGTAVDKAALLTALSHTETGTQAKLQAARDLVTSITSVPVTPVP